MEVGTGLVTHHAAGGGGLVWDNGILPYLRVGSERSILFMQTSEASYESGVGVTFCRISDCSWGRKHAYCVVFSPDARQTVRVRYPRMASERQAKDGPWLHWHIHTCRSAREELANTLGDHPVEVIAMCMLSGINASIARPHAFIVARVLRWRSAVDRAGGRFGLWSRRPVGRPRQRWDDFLCRLAGCCWLRGGSCGLGKERPFRLAVGAGSPREVRPLSISGGWAGSAVSPLSFSVAAAPGGRWAPGCPCAWCLHHRYRQGARP